MSRSIVAVACITLLAACGTELLTYEALAGTYTGTFTSTEPGGNQFTADVELVVEQTEEAITGSFEIDGVISGSGTVNTTTDGALLGTLPLGSDPMFTLYLAYSFCPQDLIPFLATLDSSSGTLTLLGELDIPNSQCSVLTAYPLDFTLNR